jgi:hypothetical protein
MVTDSGTSRLLQSITSYGLETDLLSGEVENHQMVLLVNVSQDAESFESCHTQASSIGRWVDE